MESRTKKTTYNFISSVLAQFLTIVLSFVSRSVFIYCLDARFLGVNGLFTNIISLLSLAELGVGTALIYSMYEPLAYNDQKKLAALTQFYKKLYTIIGISILVIGLLLFPFLDFFINLDVGIPNVKYYYLLFLMQSVCSYFMVYKTSIMTADQKSYILTRNLMVINSIATITQIIVLLVWHNYTIYLLIIVLFNIIGNYYNSKVAERKYPYINDKVSLDYSEKKNIWGNIKSMFLYKLGGVILNNTDNILISKIVGTIEVGIYSNYYLILSKIGNVTSLVFTSVQASLGNLNVDADEDKKKFVFDTLSLMSFWVYGFCSICFCLLFQDFIKLWVGDSYLLSDITMYICVANYYLQGVLYPIWCFRNTTGLFKETKYTMLIASLINIALSIVLGNLFGMAGIFAATIISRLLTNIWYDPYKLFKNYFKSSPINYYIKELKRVAFLIAFILFSQCFFDYFTFKSLFLQLLIKLLYAVLIPNILLFCYYRKKTTFIFLANKFRPMIMQVLRKVHIK